MHSSPFLITGFHRSGTSLFAAYLESCGFSAGRHLKQGALLPADFNPATDEYVVAGRVQEFDLDISTCHYFNMMGRFPALSVPSGIGDNGVPTGLQIAAAAYDDVNVFRVAAAFERA